MLCTRGRLGLNSSHARVGQEPKPISLKAFLRRPYFQAYSKRFITNVEPMSNWSRTNVKLMSIECTCPTYSTPTEFARHESGGRDRRFALQTLPKRCPKAPQTSSPLSRILKLTPGRVWGAVWGAVPKTVYFKWPTRGVGLVLLFGAEAVYEPFRNRSETVRRSGTVWNRSRTVSERL